MHRDLLAECLVTTGHCNQNADLAHARCCCVVHIRHDGIAIECSHTAHGHVFTNCGDLVGDNSFDGLATHVCRFQSVDVGHTQGDVADCCNHLLEVGIFANEISF